MCYTYIVNYSIRNKNIKEGRVTHQNIQKQVVKVQKLPQRLANIKTNCMNMDIFDHVLSSRKLMYLSDKLIKFLETKTLKIFASFYEDLFEKNMLINLQSMTRSCLDELIIQLNDYEQFENKIITTETQKIRKCKQSQVQKFLLDSFVDFPINKYPGGTKLSNIYNSLKSVKGIELTCKAPDELKKAYSIYKQLNLIDSDANNFYKIYGYKTFDNYILNIVDELYNWSMDNEQFFIQYKYIKLLTLKKIENSFKKDIILYMLKLISKKSSKNEKIELLMDLFPIDYLNIPVDPSNRRTTTIREENYFIHIHEINDYTRVKTLIDMPVNLKNSSQKLFNLFDKKVIKALIQLSDEDFFSTRKVTCSLGEVVKKVSTSRSAKVYKEVYYSIKKISSYRSIYENDKTKESIIYDIYTADIVPLKKYKNTDFDFEKIKTSEYGDLVVKAIFSEKYINRILEGAVFVNKDIEACYKSNMTQALLIPIQNERYKTINSPNLTVKLGFNSFFNTVLTLGNSNKSRSLQQIEASLEEIKNTKNIIQSYYRNNDFFYITFFPLMKFEKDNLLNCLEYFSNIGQNITLPYKLLDSLNTINLNDIEEK